MEPSAKNVAYVIIARIDGKYYAADIVKNAFRLKPDYCGLFYNSAPPIHAGSNCSSVVHQMWRFAVSLFRKHKKTKDDYVKVFRLNGKSCPIRLLKSQEKAKKSIGAIYAGYPFEAKPDFTK